MIKRYADDSPSILVVFSASGIFINVYSAANAFLLDELFYGLIFYSPLRFLKH